MSLGYGFARRQRSLQKRTSSHERAHFLRHVKDKPQFAQVFVGKFAFLTPRIASFDGGAASKVLRYGKCSMIGTTLTILGAIAFIAIGIAALVAPKTSSEQYGLPTTQGYALAFVRALGGRDLALGLILLAAVLTKSHAAILFTLSFSAMIALIDASLVMRERGIAAQKSLVTHTIGAVGCIVASLAVYFGL